MTPVGVRAFIVLATIGLGIPSLGIPAEAQTPCPDLIRLRNAATAAWKQAMSVPRSERCGALYHAALTTEATLKLANNTHDSCDMSGRLLNDVERSHREAVQARDNACAGRPLRPYPPDIIQH